MPKGQVIPRLKRAPQTRSAVSNRTRLFVDQDARGPWARRYADLVAMIADDLGGPDGMTELKLGMVRRAAALMLECERLEGELAMGAKVDIDQLGRITGHLRRIGETLGLDRVVRDITPSLSDIIRAHAETAPHSKASQQGAAAEATEPRPRAVRNAAAIDDAPAAAFEAASGAPAPAQGRSE